MDLASRRALQGPPMSSPPAPATKGRFGRTRRHSPTATASWFSFVAVRRLPGGPANKFRGVAFGDSIYRRATLYDQ